MARGDRGKLQRSRWGDAGSGHFHTLDEGVWRIEDSLFSVSVCLSRI